MTSGTSSLVPTLEFLPALPRLAQARVSDEDYPVWIFRQRVRNPKWLDRFPWQGEDEFTRFEWRDESNKRDAIRISQNIIRLSSLELSFQVEFEIQSLARVFFRDCMAHFDIAVTEMREWGQISGLRKWEKDFLWISLKDYPLPIPSETIRLIQILLKLAEQGVPVSKPQITVRKMYFPENASLVVEMGGWFVVHSWTVNQIESSFQKVKIRKCRAYSTPEV